MSNKIEILSFDELARFHGLSLMKWDEDNYASENTELAKDFFEAGQQSKQDEVDELKMGNHNLSVMVAEAESYSEYWKYERDKLQKRLDEINNHLEINYDENRDDDSHSYWSGYNQALRELFEIIKGDSHES